MARYLLKRLALLPLTLFTIACVHVVILHIVPGGPDAWMHAHTLNTYGLPLNIDTYPTAFVVLGRICALDFGQSYFFCEPVMTLIARKLPTTLYLTLTAFVFLYPLAILIGWLLYKKNRQALCVQQLSMAFSSTPSCLFYTLLAIVSYQTNIALNNLGLAIAFLVLRRLASLASLIARYFHEHQNALYITLAYQRGVNPWRVFIHYTVKNALLPIWIKFPKHCLQVLFFGTLTIEMLFSIDGFGRLSMIAMKSHDYPLILGCLLFSCLCLSSGYILSDLLHQAANPQTRIAQ